MSQGKGPLVGSKGRSPRPSSRLRMAAIGFESEFEVWVGDRKVRPEDIFGSPRTFLRGPLVHRQGTSYHLPTGGAVYFDTGVVEVATPVIEIEPGCAARAGRSLWEAIRHVRADLDVWERRDGRHVRLSGFSSHYNISFELSPEEQGEHRTVEQLARLLIHILPFPVALLVANRASTGIGVRPRGDRIEITADFTPSAALMIAAGTFITGVVRSVMRWPSFGLDEAARRGVPVVTPFEPMPHTSRKGWLARASCYADDPFGQSPDARVWQLAGGPRDAARDGDPDERLSLRDVASRVFDAFAGDVARMAEPATFALIERVMHGHTPSLLDLAERPDAYDHVGRLCLWDDLFPEEALARSRYERVMIRAIARVPLYIDGAWLRPVGMHGWADVVFERIGDGTRISYAIDQLVPHLDRWERRR